jgi:thermitase
MKKAIIASVAAALITFGPLAIVPAAGAASPPSGGTPPSVDGPIAQGQILVKFHDDRSSAGVLQRFGLGNGPSIGSTGARRIAVPAGQELRLVDALSHSPAVEYAEPDAVASATTNDQYFPRQYALQNDGLPFTNTAGTITVAAGTKGDDIDAVNAWALTRGDGVAVAVLDTGVTTDNDDITPKVVKRANFGSGETGQDNYGHGTHVAGIIAATAGNGIGVAGVCPGCTILDGKVLDDNGYGTSSDIAEGINWAVTEHAAVINMSLGMRVSSRTLEAAVDNAWKAGLVIVAAAGNTGAQAKMYPGAYTNVIAVAATDNNDAKASFSTYGAKWVDVAAPGVSVYSTFPNHKFGLEANGRSRGYDIASGTSMASPIVAATAALVVSRQPSAGNTTVRAKVESGAEKIAGTGSYWAYGRVNAYNAVK